MEKILKLFFLLLTSVMFMTGCIVTVSPGTNAPVKVSESQAFTATASGDLVWILDGNAVFEGGVYIYKVDPGHFGEHHLVVKEKGALPDSRKWTIIDIGEEVCDGIDNDGNGAIDDNIAPVSSECGVGGCHATGERTCVNGKIVDTCVVGEAKPLPNCITEPFPDDQDQNCDGILDTVQVTEFCQNEICNGIDDNMNGLIDENMPVTSTTCGVGPCTKTGERRCVDGVWVDSCQFPKEICGDCLDNDCNGVVDENCPKIPTTCGVGACQSTGETKCVNGQLVDTCKPGTPSSEVCDGMDNDCNGKIDNLPCQYQDCGGCTVQAAVMSCCTNGAWIPPLPECPPVILETCPHDGIDNDCNGLVDDIICSCPAPTTVTASDIGSGLPYVQITWNGCPVATHYKIYRAIWEQDAEYALVGDTTETSFEYHQDWTKDVDDHIRDIPRMDPDATMEEKTAFGKDLDAFRQESLPYYMNYKCPSFFKVQACDDDLCYDLSDPEPGQAELIHTAEFSEVAELVIPFWLYPLQFNMSTIEPGVYSLTWCWLDLCGPGGGMVLGRLRSDPAPIQMDIWYDGWKEKWGLHPNATFSATGLISGAQSASLAAKGIAILQGNFDIEISGTHVDAYAWYYFSGMSGYPNAGEMDITVNGQTYTFPLPVQPAGWVPYPSPTVILPRPGRPALGQKGTPVEEWHMPIGEIGPNCDDFDDCCDNDFDGECDDRLLLCPNNEVYLNPVCTTPSPVK